MSEHEAQGYEIKIKERVRLNAPKRYMAKNMLASWNAIPHFTQMANANASSLIRLKKELGDVSYNDLLVKIVANAVAQSPIVNSTMDGDHLIIYDDINISVAIGTERGLFVPVVREVNRKGVRELSAEIKVLAEKAAKGAIMPDDMAFGTLTVSNLGRTAVENGTPIINAPQSTLVFFGAIRREPIVNERDEVVPGDVIGLCCCYDHKVLDGLSGQAFTTLLKQEIETVSADKML